MIPVSEPSQCTQSVYPASGQRGVPILAPPNSRYLHFRSAVLFSSLPSLHRRYAVDAARGSLHLPVCLDSTLLCFPNTYPPGLAIAIPPLPFCPHPLNLSLHLHCCCCCSHFWSLCCCNLAPTTTTTAVSPSDLVLCLTPGSTLAALLGTQYNSIQTPGGAFKRFIITFCPPNLLLPLDTCSTFIIGFSALPPHRSNKHLPYIHLLQPRLPPFTFG